MIKTTLGTLVGAEASLTTLAQAKLSVKAVYKLKTLLSALERDLTHYNTERVAMFKEWGRPKDDGDLEIPPEHREAFLQRTKELLALEIEIPAEPFNLALVEADVKLSKMDWDLMGPFVTYAE